MDVPAHQAVQELLPWYASSQLGPEETQRVHAHLQTCMQCRRDLEWEHGMRGEARRGGDELPAGVDMEHALARLLPTLGPQERVASQPAAGGLAAQPAQGATSGSSAAPAAVTAVDDSAGLPASSAAYTDAALSTSATGAGGAGQPVAGGAHAGPALPTAADHGQQQPASVASTAPRVQPWWRTPAANQPSWLRWAAAAQFVALVGLGALLLRPADEPAYRVLGSGTAASGNVVVMFQPNTSERELRRILQAQNARVVDGPTVTDAYLLSVPAASRDQALQALRAEAAVKLAEPMDGGGTP